MTFLLSDLVPPFHGPQPSSEYSQWLPCPTPLVPSARGVAAGPAVPISYERLAILGHAARSFDESLPISALLHLIFAHVSQVRQQQATSSARRRNLEAPLVLLLSGSERSEMRTRLEKERSSWVASMNADARVQDGQGEHVAKWDSVWDAVEIRYLPTLHHLLAFVALMRKSLPLASRHDQVRVANPGPTGKMTATKEHQRILLFPRPPTLIVVEGLSALLSEESSYTVSHLTNALSFVLDLASHLSTDIWLSPRSRARKRGDDLQTQQTQLTQTNEEPHVGITRPPVPVVLFDQRLASMSLALRTPEQAAPQEPARDTPVASHATSPAASRTPTRPSVLPLKRVVDRFFDYVVDVTHLDPPSDTPLRRRDAEADRILQATHTLALRHSEERPLAPPIVPQEIRAAYIPADDG